jgi:hypothetical protein
MAESNMNPNAPRISLGEALATRRSKINREPSPAPTPSQYDEMYASLKQHMDLRNLAMLSGIADGGLSGKPAPVIDPIDQVSKFNAAIGVNVGELMKAERAAKEAAENARNAAEKAVADMKYEMITRAIADSRAESAAIVKEVKELLQNKPKSRYLFGEADEATDGQFTKEHLQRLFGKSEKPVDPEDAVFGVIERADRLKKALGINQQPEQKDVPLEKNIEYHRLILEDKRFTETERAKLAIEEKRIHALENFTTKIGTLIEDLAGSYMASRGGGNGGQTAAKEKKAPEREQITFQNTEFEAKPCPYKECGKPIPWPKNVQNLEMTCPYCKRPVHDEPTKEEKKA